MDWKSFFQSFLANAVWWLLVLGGGIALGFLKAKKPTWAGPLLYGLAGAAFIAIIIYTVMGHAIVSKQQPQTTPENVETNIRAWSDGFHLAVQRQLQPTNPPSYFLLLVTLPDGIPVLVGRTTKMRGIFRLTQ